MYELFFLFDMGIDNIGKAFLDYDHTLPMNQLENYLPTYNFLTISVLKFLPDQEESDFLSLLMVTSYLPLNISDNSYR